MAPLKKSRLSANDAFLLWIKQLKPKRIIAYETVGLTLILFLLEIKRLGLPMDAGIAVIYANCTLKVSSLQVMSCLTQPTVCASKALDRLQKGKDEPTKYDEKSKDWKYLHHHMNLI